jgi:alpha-ribazole phosphatase
MRIDLLRHGATVLDGCYCGSTDVALSPHGLQQMWAAVSDRCWDRIVSSPLQRCAAFARELAQRLSIPLVEDDRLRELHFGDWEGQRTDELFARDSNALKRFWSDPAAHPPPQGERLVELQARVMAALRELIGAGGGNRVLLVTHGGPIRVLLGERRKLPLSRLLEIDVPHASLIPFLDRESAATIPF